MAILWCQSREPTANKQVILFWPNLSYLSITQVIMTALDEVQPDQLPRIRVDDPQVWIQDCHRYYGYPALLVTSEAT